MGRFYKTATPAFVDDKMFQLPWQLMANTLMNKEKAVDTEIGEANSFLDRLTAQGLSPDQPRIKEIISGYENRINEVVNNIKQNPMEYNKYSDVIRTLGRDINKDWSMGEISKIEANRKAYTDYSTQLDEAYKKNSKELSPVQIDRLKQQALEKYKQSGGAGYNPQSGSYNQFSGEDALQLGNVTDILNQNVGKYIKSDSGEKAYLNNEGKWMMKTHKGEEAVSAEKLKAAATAYLESAPEMISAIKQRTQLGIQGFEDPMAYINDSINSFILANEYKKESITKDANVNPYYMKDYEWSHEKQQDEEDIVSYATTGKIESTAGSNLSEYKEKRVGIFASIKEAKTTAQQKIMDTYNLKDLTDMKIKQPVIYNRIQRGDFSDIENLPGGRDIANGYRQAQYNLAGQEALKNKFKKETGRDADQNMTKFGDWLTTRPVIAPKQIYSWQGFTDAKGEQITPKQIDQVAKRVFTDQLYLDSPMDIPKGIIVKVGGKSIDLSAKRYTINELVNLGIARPKQVNIGSNIKGTARVVNGPDGKPLKDAEGNTVTEASNIIEYELVDGSGTIGFQISSKGIVPSTSYDDQGKIGVGIATNIKGKNFITNINDIQTQSMLSYSNKNDKYLKTKLQLERYNESGDVVLKNGARGQVVYHSEDVIENGKVIYKKGDVTIRDKKTNTRKTFPTSDSKGLESLSNLMYK